MCSQQQILNIATYKFVRLQAQQLPVFQERFRRTAIRLHLKGTILLSEEGINLFMSGRPDYVKMFQDMLAAEEPFADLTYKSSYSSDRAFKRVYVKIKEEIIAMGQPVFNAGDAPALPPDQLKQWIAEGKDFLLLDTRNDYEVEMGTFATARHLNISTFKQFPQAVENLPAEDKRKPVVVFCTGGIRCEKAAPWMLENGFSSVYQLDGGILNYFEQCHDDQYDGECFVFDERVAVDGELSPLEALAAAEKVI